MSVEESLQSHLPLELKKNREGGEGWRMELDTSHIPVFISAQLLRQQTCLGIYNTIHIHHCGTSLTSIRMYTIV